MAVVTFDSQAATRFSFTDHNGDLDYAKAAIDSNVALHDDPPVNKLFASWYNAGTNGRYNPVDPEDRDNNGADNDPKSSPSADSTVCTITDSGGDRWDTTKNIPCDNKDYNDAFDWDQDGLFTSGVPCNLALPNPPGDDCKSLKWINDKSYTNSDGTKSPMSLVSTCSGCGIREATSNLVNNGRSNAVWVIVFLSDGLANMSDTPATFPYNAGTHRGIPSIYPNGFCGGKIDVTGTGSGLNYWKTNCVDWDVSTRYCINDDPATCPPGSVALVGNGSFSPLTRRPTAWKTTRAI